MAYDKLDQLYDALKKDGAVSKSRENFRGKMLAPGKEGYQNRLQLYNALKADGAVSSPTYEEFGRRLGLHAVKAGTPANRQAVSTAGTPAEGGRAQNLTGVQSTAGAQSTTGTAGARSTTGTASARSTAGAHGATGAVGSMGTMGTRGGAAPAGVQNGVQQAKVQNGAGGTHNGVKGGGMTAAERQAMLGNVGNMLAKNNASMRQAQNRMDYAKANAGLKVPHIAVGEKDGGLKLGQNSKVTAAKPRYDAASGEMKQTYITESGNEFDNRAEADTEQNSVDQYKDSMTVNGQLNAAYAERDRLDAALKKRAKEIDDRPGQRLSDFIREMAAGSTAAGPLAVHDTRRAKYEDDEEYMQLMAAARKNHQTIQLLEDKKNGKMNSFWHSLGTTATDGYTFNDGMSEMRDATAQEKAKEHIDSINRKHSEGKPLTKEEETAEAVLKNFATDDAVQGMYGGQYGAWSRAGAMTANSIDFVKDIILDPLAGGIAKGVAKGTAKTLAKGIAKATGKEAAQLWKNKVLRLTLKATGVLPGAHIAGLHVSNTAGIGRTGAAMAGLTSGSVGVDEKGGYKVENATGLLPAFAEAERQQAGGNGSEMFGEFIPGVGGMVKKGLGKIGLSKIAGAMTSIGNKEWYKQYSRILEAGGYNGLPGEVLEEYEGSLFDALTGHADDAWDDMTSLQNHVDIWLGCATMGALLGAVPSMAAGYHTAQYYRYKHNTDNADRVAAFRMTAKRWEPLRDRIDGTDNGNMADVVTGIINGTGLNAEEKKAALDYVRNLTRMRGYNIAEANNADDGKAQSPEAQGVNGSYSDGYETTDPEAVLKAWDDKNLRQEQVRQERGSIESTDEIDKDPLGYIEKMKTDGDTYGMEAVVAYVNAKAKYDGMEQRVYDDIDSRVEESNATIASHVNRADGMTHPASLKEQDEDGTDKAVYVVSGNVVMNEDGTGVDTERSDKEIVVRDAATGELRMIAADEVHAMGEAIDPEEEKAEAQARIAEEMAARVAAVAPTEEQAASTAGTPAEGGRARNQAGTETAETETDAQGATETAETETGAQGATETTGDENATGDGNEGGLGSMGAIGSIGGELDAEPDEGQGDEPDEGQGGEHAAELDEGQDTGEEAEQGSEAGEPMPMPEYGVNDGFTVVDAEGNTVSGEVQGINADGVEIRTDSPLNGRRVQIVPKEEFESMVESLSDAEGNAMWRRGARQAPSDSPNRGSEEHTEGLTPAEEQTASTAGTPAEGGRAQNQAGTETAETETDAQGATETAETETGTTETGTETAETETGTTETEADTAETETGAQGATETTGDENATGDENGNDTESTANGQGSALSRVPKDEKTGEPMFEKTDSGTALAAIDELTGGNEANTAAIVNAQAEQAGKELEALKKKQPKKKAAKLTGSPMAMIKAQQEADANYNAAMEQYNAQVAAAEEKAKAWNGIVGAMRGKQQAVREQQEAERKEQDRRLHDEAVAQQQADYEARKKAEAERKAVGNGNPMPAIADKWDNAPKEDGYKDEIMLPDGTPLKGHYVLHESGASSPSHNPQTWQKTEGFPMDANDNSVNDRDYERDRDAQEHTKRIAGHYDQRALQSVPVVSSDGVVLSGNGRTMAGELAAQNNTDGAYVSYLKGYAHKFGFTPEQVESMAHPRVSFVPDEAMPYTAETFAKFNQQEMKSQNKTEQAVKLGKTVSDESFRKIVRTINGYDTLGDFYNDAEASLDAVYDLKNAGVVAQAQLAEMVDGVRGQEKLSAVGREFLENMLIGKAFDSDPDVVRMLTAEPAMRQTVITALGEIADNIALGKDWSVQKELSDAVRLCFDARNGGTKYGEIVSVYARQGELFADPGELQTTADFNNATMLMLADVLNDKRVTLLKATLQLYNDEARQSASGQTDLFAGGVKSREDILNNVTNYINENYGRRKEIESARAAAVERRKAESVQQDGADATSGGESEAETKNGSDGLRNNGRGRAEGRPDPRQGDLAEAGDVVSSSERAEMGNRITDWLSEENLERAAGKTREEIFEEFGNELAPIAYIPAKHLSLLGDNVKDPRIYCGKGYFIDHALRNHGGQGTQIDIDDVDVGKYLNIQYVLDNPDHIKETFTDGKRTVVFIKKIGRYFAELTQLEENGRIVLHKSMFNQKKEPYAKLPDIRQKDTSSEGGASSISHADNAAPAISLESRGDAVSSEPRGTGTSEGKVNDNTPTVQGKGEKSVEKGGIDWSTRDEAPKNEGEWTTGTPAEGGRARNQAGTDTTEAGTAATETDGENENGLGSMGTRGSLGESEHSKGYTITPTTYTNKKGKTTAMHLVKFDSEPTKEQVRAGKELAKESRGWWDSKQGGFMMRSEESAKELAEALGSEEAVQDAQPMSAKDMEAANDKGAGNAAGKKAKTTKKPKAANRVEAAEQTEGQPKAEHQQEETKEEPKQEKEEPKQEAKTKSKWVDDADAERFEELRKRLRMKLRGQLNMGIDPEAFSIGVEMSFLMLKHGARKFSEYAKNMIEALGEDVRPYLKSFYNGARDLPEMEAFEKELTPYDEVRAFDVKNFDKKGAKDMLATAEHIVKEQALEREAQEATDKLKSQRNEQRKEDDKQSEADTAALASESEAVASEAETVAKTSRDRRTVCETTERVDEALDKVNDRLALLGYYEADEVEKDYNEQYGYMRNAEKKAVKDAANLAGSLIDDLGLDRYEATHGMPDKKGKRKTKPLAVANIAPIGGDITMHLPLAEGRELYMNISLGSVAAKGAYEGGDNLEVQGLYFRVENPNGKGMERYGRNIFVARDATYKDLLELVQRDVYKYIPQRADVADGEYKAGDKVEYTHDGGRTWTEGVVVQPNDMDGIRIDTGHAPVMWVNATKDQLRHKDAPQGEDGVIRGSHSPAEGGRAQNQTGTGTAGTETDGENENGSGSMGARGSLGGTAKEDIFQKAERIAKEEQTKHADVVPVGKGKFGDVYNQFKGDAQGAFAFLSSHKGGDLLGVFHRDGVGDIDVVWGDKGGGFDHIISKHVGEGKSFSSINEAAQVIENIITTGKKEFENGDRIVFKKGSKLVTIRTNVREKGKKIADKNWVLTAYDELSADGGVSAIAPAIEVQTARHTDKTDRKVTTIPSKSKAKSKNKVKPEQQVGGLFAGLFDKEQDNGLERDHDAVRTGGLQADGGGNGRRGSVEDDRRVASQESGGPDGSRKGEGGRAGGAVPQSDGRPDGRLQGLDGRKKERKNVRNNHSERGVDHAPKTVGARYNANVEAIKLAHELLESGQTATPEQMGVLRQYSGWGGLGSAFKVGNDWKQRERNKELRELLGEKAYEEAVMSANSAYYTPAYVVDTLWDIARQLGFKGGKILEGSAGIGNIIGQIPMDMNDRSDIHAIEIDGTSGGILSLLYPDAKVDIQGFEETRIPNGSVDLAITNVPFVAGMLVKDKTGDGDLSKKFRNIQDFCIAKNVRKLREGGLGIFITSNGTLDNSQKLRDWVVNEGGADFVGAFRMHNETFGGAPVTSDIIVIRKRVNGKESPNAIDVSTVSGERTAEYQAPGERKKKELSMDYNKYFIEHPGHMAGEMHFGFEKGNDYRGSVKGLYPAEGKDQGKMLQEFVKTLNAEEGGERASETQVTMPNVYEELGKDVKEGSMVVDSDGNICIAQYGKAVPMKSEASKSDKSKGSVSEEELRKRFQDKKIKGHPKAECFGDYTAIKSALSDVMKYQTEHEGDAGLQPLIDKLNKAYDGFVAKYGHLTKNNQLAWLRNDVDYPNVFSLEDYREQGDGKGGVTKTYGKADVMKRRVVEKEAEPHPENVKDGVVVSMSENGRIDIPYIAGQLDKSEAAVKREIIESGLGFEDPTTKQVEVSYRYLSGNVREKLRQAEAGNENGEYAGNIKALQDVLPMSIPAHLIDFALGSSWLSPKLYEEYVKDRTDIDVKFTAVGGSWYMDEPYYTAKEKNRAMGVVSEKLDVTIYGHELIGAAIQNKTVRVSKTEKHYDGTTETTVDREATAACAAKIDEIRQDFKDWMRQKMQGDAELSAKMETEYNDRFNNYVPMRIPNEFVPEFFGGATHKFKMRPHQGKAIVRGTMQPLLLAHEVGTGKTFTLISTAMEMRRLGTARKPMIVVQNATVGQFVASAKELYPNAKILTLEEGDRNAEGRKNFYAKIKYNDWDMIVVPQSTFERIPDSDERQMAFIKDKIEEKEAVLEQMKEADSSGRDPVTRQAEREIESLRAEYDALGKEASAKRSANDEKKRAVARQNASVKAQEMLDRKVDDVENFDDMGIDALLVDEAHEYKHLGFATAMQRGVKGVDPSYSKKSQGVYLKTQAVLQKSKGRNVVFATGTPISNTAAEIWTFMRYLMPADTMKDYGIYYFDDFVRNFGNIQQMPEFGASGKFKEVNRFAGYVNLPELVRIWSGVADTVLTKDQKELVDKIPEMEGGKAQDIYLPQTRALRRVMKYVKEELQRFEEMSGKEKKENSHIPLTMYGIAQSAAVDARLVVSDAEDEPNSKTNEAVRQTLRSLKETDSYKGTVAVFADHYQNKSSGFNLFEDVKKKLVAQGVAEKEIVIMKPGMTIKAKLDIFDKVNHGEIRVIMGSTATLGTGVNIQERLHTLIHLDAPNRPMDYTQRNGRILRQGNLHKQWGKPVRVLRFGVEDSLDVTAYQRLKTKGAIADSVMEGDKLMKDSMNNRVLEEEEDVFGDTVAQLSGSEYALLKNNAEKNVRKYESRKKQWEADQTYIHNAKPKLQGQIREAEQRAEVAGRYLQAVRKAFPDGKFREITAGKQKFGSLEAMGDFIKDYNKAILDAVKAMKAKPGSDTQTRTLTLSVGGYDFTVETRMWLDTVNDGGLLSTEAHRVMSYSCPELGVENRPVKQALLRNALEDITENVITGKDFEDRYDRATRTAEHDKSELEQLKKREGKPFEFGKELEEAYRQLDEYTEAMKAELEEKEKKYAEMDKTVEAATDVVVGDEDEEDDTKFRLFEDEDPNGAAAPAEGGRARDQAGTETTETDTDGENENGLGSMGTRGSLGEGPTGATEAKRMEAERLAGKFNTRLNIIEDTNAIVHDNPTVQARRRKAKGWYDTRTGEVTIVLPNNMNVEDVAETVFHETVGHKGLRELIGEKGYSDFLREVYAHAKADVRRRIAKLAAKHNWDFDKATDEYLAGLAEKGFEDFDREERSMWQWLKEKVMAAIDKFLNTLKLPKSVKLGDNELRYMLWRSKERLERGKEDIFDMARDIAKREELGLSETAQYKTGDANEALDIVNKRFNHELTRYQNGEMDKNEMLHLGRPQGVMRAFLPNLPIVMRQRVIKKGSEKKHEVDVSAIMNMPQHLSSPIFVFQRSEDTIGVLTDMRDRNGKNVCVAIELKRQIQQGAQHLEVNDVRSFHGREFKNIVGPIANNKTLKWVDKEKGLAYLSSASQPVQQEIDKQVLDTAAKVVKDFVNPKILERNVAEEGLGMMGTRGETASAPAEGGRAQNRTSEGSAETAGAQNTTATGDGSAETAEAVGSMGIRGSIGGATDEGIMYRDGDSVEYEKAMARDTYERRVSRGMYQTQEALQDSMLGLKEAMDAILKAEGGTYGGRIEDVAGYENAYLGENRLSSVNQAECSEFAKRLFKPLLAEVAELAGTADERAELTDYMMARHGLERNEVMARRSAQKDADKEYGAEIRKAERAVANDPSDQDALDALAAARQHRDELEGKLYMKNRSRDYSGLTALTETDNVADAEDEAKRMVADYEQRHGTILLWARVNNVTKATLRKTYESGLINKAVYDDISSMYAYYIPLRGFDEETSAEAYAYLADRHSAFNSPIKTAKGRKSKADDPFANMEAMAESAIMQGNRNVLVKQKFLNFALNHPSDLVSVSDLWLRYDDVKGEWEPMNTGDIAGTEPIEDDDSAADVERKMRDFEAAMEKAAKSDPAHFQKQKDNPAIPYRVVESRDLRQHQVLVKRNGKDVIMTVNGNPRAAQALNGQTNPDNDVSGAIGAVMHLGEYVNRQLSAFYTTRNPDFVVSNFVRDLLYSNSMVWVKESPNYAWRYNRNVALVNPAKMKRLLARLREDELDMTDETDKLFYQFMMNGGETGYANIRDIEQRKNDIKRELKKNSGQLPLRLAWDLLGERLDEYNRAVELCARFAAFKTSRELGRTIDRSVYDAKEISVNFNKKGSGAKFLNTEGQTAAGNAAAVVSGLGRSFYVFWNAGIQGTTNFGRQIGRHPKKAMAGMASMFLLGALMAATGGGDDGDDEYGQTLPGAAGHGTGQEGMKPIKEDDGSGDRNAYYNLPEYVRRSNIVFRLPWMDKSWVALPLPVEYRAMYGMGELAVSALSGKEHYTAGELAHETASQISQMMPLDFMEGGGGFKAFIPSAVKPFAEVMTNESWTGMPIYKDTPFNKNAPEWTKAYKSANPYLVGASKWLNEKTGGDYYKKGKVDINPAKVEYLMNGLFGGMSRSVDEMVKMGETAIGRMEYDPKNMMFLNRLVKRGDERTEYRAVNNEYWRIREECETLRELLNHYERDTADGVFDYAEKIAWLNNSPEYRVLMTYEPYAAEIRDMEEMLREAERQGDRLTAAKVETDLNQCKACLVRDVEAVRKGKLVQK